VLKLAGQFNCVVVDRDATPDIPKIFSVSAYPSMLILSPKEENIFRWSGYAETDPYLHQMRAALGRYELYAAGKDWDTPEPRAAAISDSGAVTVFDAPVDDRLSGLCYSDGVLWCLFQDKLFGLDPSNGKTRYTIKVDGKDLYVDLATDATYLYLVPYGWTAGQDIVKYNLKRGAWETPIETAANKANKVYSARGIAARNGSLYVSSHLGIQKVNPLTGAAAAAVNVQLDGYRIFGIMGLDFDGADLVGAGTMEKVKLDAEGKPLDNSYGLDKDRPRLNAILRIDPETGKVSKFDLLNYPVNAISSADGVFWLSEQPETGFDRRNQPVRIYPRRMSIHRLVLSRAASEKR
jgi:hypothetical protein